MKIYALRCEVDEREPFDKKRFDSEELANKAFSALYKRFSEINDTTEWVEEMKGIRFRVVADGFLGKEYCEYYLEAHDVITTEDEIDDMVESIIHPKPISIQWVD